MRRGIPTLTPMPRPTLADELCPLESVASELVLFPAPAVVVVAAAEGWFGEGFCRYAHRHGGSGGCLEAYCCGWVGKIDVMRVEFVGRASRVVDGKVKDSGCFNVLLLMFLFVLTTQL